MEAPECLFLDAESQVYRVAGRRLKDSNIEYIRADLVRPEAVKRLIEAASDALSLMEAHALIDHPYYEALESALAEIGGEGGE